MCAGCADWIAACSELECGARARRDEAGEVRRHYLRHFYLDEIPCGHVLAVHAESCLIRQGRPCDCDDE